MPNTALTFEKEELIIYKLGNIEASLESIKTAQTLFMGESKMYGQSFDNRIKSLENSRSWAYGMVATLSTFISLIVTSISRWVLPHG